ncbi:MAG: hypothetical protein U1E78_04475 [Gammaproteobacteria bacterium]
MKTNIRLLLGALSICAVMPLWAADVVADADMLRKDREQLERLKQPGVDLPANLVQDLDPAIKQKCIEKDEQHMRDGGAGKYACMEGYEKVPQVDIGDFDTPPKGEHPIFQNRMGNED